MLRFSVVFPFRTWWLAGLLLGVVVPAQALDDRDLLTAHRAFERGDLATLQQLSTVASGHRLAPYVTGWQLITLLRSRQPYDGVAVDAFLKREHGTALADQVRRQWLHRLARDEQWARFLDQFDALPTPGRTLQCHAWLARLTRGGDGVAAETRTLWHDQVDQPLACDALLQTQWREGRVDADDLWWRVRRLVELRELAAARTTISWLPRDQRPDLAMVTRALDNPGRFLTREAPSLARTRWADELIMAALVLFAREDLHAAWRRIDPLGKRLDPAAQAYLRSALALFATYYHDYKADDWWSLAGNTPLTHEQRTFAVRAAIRAGNWPQVRSRIARLTDEERALPEWRYWLARAQAELNDRAAAQTLFDSFRDDDSFYGVLAREALGQRLVLPSPGKPDADTARAVAADARLQRARALYRLGLDEPGRLEWNAALRDRDTAFRLAAARQAAAWELHDRAIQSAEWAGGPDALALRFPTPFRDEIEAAAQARALDPAWVFGLIRQESRFMVPATSHAGARGLMQVMPATGRYVARRIGVTGFDTARMAEPATNLLLGTSYLRMMLDDLEQHPVLASAGYNAGPGRARRWQPAQPMEAVRFIATIPFDETRDYVMKVMTNTLIYASLAGREPPTLTELLGTIPAARPSRAS